MTSILNKAIQAIEQDIVKEPDSLSDYSWNSALVNALKHLRSLLPADEAQRKEDMKEAYMASRSKVFPDLLDKQFETWYNEKYKK